MIKKTMVIYLPPLTDVRELLGNYANLLSVQGIPHQIPCSSQGNFNHPIPDDQNKLLSEFINTMKTLADLRIHYTNIQCSEVNVGQRSVVFVFTMDELSTVYTQAIISK